MSRVMLALGSFIVGACTMLLAIALLGSHTSTFAQAPSPGPTVNGTAGVPIIPPIRTNFGRFGLANMGIPFVVDGSNCVDCDFSNAAMVYGGGAFQFTRFKFKGPVRVQLVGAAANTVAFLNFVQALAASQTPPKAAPNSPIMKTAVIEQINTGDFSSPFSGSK